MCVVSGLVRVCAAFCLFIGLAVSSKPSAAYAIVALGANGIGGAFPSPYLNERSDIEVAGSISDVGSTAQGFANLATGILRSSAVSVGLGTTATTAQSIVEDSFRFSPNASGVAFLDWSIDGKITDAAHGYGMGSIAFLVASPDAAVDRSLYVFSSDQFICDGILTETTCSVGSEFSASGSLAISIAPGSYFVQVNLTAAAASEGAADFWNTAHLYLRTPDGVSIESDSGRFLASASPIGVVPVPATAALVLAGLGLAGAAGSRSRGRHVVRPYAATYPV